MDSYRIMLVKEPGKSYPDFDVPNSEAAAAVIMDYIGNSDREIIVVLAFDARLYIIGIHTVSMGTLDSAMAHPREVYKFAILSNANSILIGHNHPSGNPHPSDADFKVFDKMKIAGEYLGIELLDSVVVGYPDRYYSIKSNQEGRLKVTNKLPMFKGYSVDRVLKEFRKVKFKNGTPSMETVPFNSVKGSKLLNDYEESCKVLNDGIKRLRCCSCGEDTWGRQWYNRDAGFGLCHVCADRISQKETPEYMFSTYGAKGVHYYVEAPING